MTGRQPSWDDLQRPSQAPNVSTQRFDDLCANVFMTPLGRELLKDLRHRYFDIGGNPLADERALRVRITQQQFVRDLEIACERGRAAMKERGQS